jgi:NAD-dependent protein deacetylase/lipoamidase
MMTMEDLNTHLDRAAAALLRARYVIALVGAGISVESGIPPFRGKGGLWTKHGEPPMDGYQRFMADPAAGWRDMLARRATNDEFSHAIASAQPNAAHHALARLEEIGVLQHTISQNIDNLHFVAGNVAVTEIHGNRTKVRCINCDARWGWDEFVALAAAAPSHSADTSDDTIAEVGGVMMRVPPECPQCASIVKSDVVMFGEPIPQYALAECYRQAEQADCVLIAGTSAVVYPAAHFPEMVLQNGGAAIEVNIDETPYSPHTVASLRGRAAEMLPLLVERVIARRAGGD